LTVSHSKRKFYGTPPVACSRNTSKRPASRTPSARGFSFWSMTGAFSWPPSTVLQALGLPEGLSIYVYWHYVAGTAGCAMSRLGPRLLRAAYAPRRRGLARGTLIYCALQGNALLSVPAIAAP
jgi:hypothetical protein